MDLAYLLSRYQNALRSTSAAACVASRASHCALAAAYAERIRAYRIAQDMAEAA
ncbi:hypothetical protein ACTJKY_15460 [Sphingomonas sp. 22176]